MTNLEWLKKTINGEEGNSCFCAVLFKKVKNKTCGDASCSHCPFNYYKDIIDYLLQEHEEKIKITQLEYDMLEITKDFNNSIYCLNENIYFEQLKEKGYFKNVDLKMNAKDILENCEIVPNDYEF